MAVPKRKPSKSRIRRRRRVWQKTSVPTSACPKCGEPKLSHRVCKSCGYYKDRQVLTVEAD